jgi:predicted RNA-binding protein with PUA-like domain
MPTYLLKTEPSEYAFADLQRDGKTIWSGISNAAALIHLRSMKKGDEAFIYHTGNDKAIVGLAQVVSNPFEDPEQPGQTPDGQPKFAVVELKALRPARSPLTLARIKADGRFKSFQLVTHPRLSVIPVPPAIDAALRAMSGL